MGRDFRDGFGERPRLTLGLTGDGQKGGATLALSCDNFSLHGEKGSRVPGMSLESVVLSVEIIMEATAEYDPERGTWSMPEEAFRMVRMEAMWGAGCGDGNRETETGPLSL